MISILAGLRSRLSLQQRLAFLVLMLWSAAAGHAEWRTTVAGLPRILLTGPSAPRGDWLLEEGLGAAAIFRGTDDETVVLANGIVARIFKIGTVHGTVGLEDLATGNSILRAAGCEAELALDGNRFELGGLAGQPDRGYLPREAIAQLTNRPSGFQFAGFSTNSVAAPFGWKRVRHHAELAWPPSGAALDFLYRGDAAATVGLSVVVHYEIYDGIPVIGKWITLSNLTSREIVLDRFVVERLSVVEAEAAVDERPSTAWRTPPIDVLSDYMFHGMDVVTGNAIASWQTDPEYKTQVSYAYQTPCVLVIRPPMGPGVHLQPGSSFRSFRTYLVFHDSTDRERQGLTLRHAQRTLAPWITENPIMMHVRHADAASFRLAVDQCAEAGFEMIIYTFGRRPGGNG